VQPQARADAGERRSYGGRRFEGASQTVRPQATPPVDADRGQFTGRRAERQAGPGPSPFGFWRGEQQRRQLQADDRQSGDRRLGERNQTQPQAQPQQPSRQWDGRRGGRTDGRDFNRDGRSGDRNGWTRDPNGWNRDGGRGGWDRDHHGPAVRPGWATRDGRHDRDRNRPHYDVHRYPHFFNFGHRYRIAPYVSPFGFFDYSWGYGDYLPWGWYGPNYWIDDWWDYGLPAPPAGCEWVRVGSDALLIDTFDGRVLSVARALFW
jgi:Ni/Co efflux regulator RcnB